MPAQLRIPLEVMLTEQHLRAAYARSRLSVSFEAALSQPAIAAALRASAKASLTCRPRGASGRRRK